MKQVRETRAAQSLSAYVILRDGAAVATVQFYFGDTGAVQCDVYSPYDLVHQRKVGGGGYDKQTASIAGAEIGDYKIENSGIRWYNQLESNGFIVECAI